VASSAMMVGISWLFLTGGWRWLGFGFGAA
jgi:hypothetical protein